MDGRAGAVLLVVAATVACTRDAPRHASFAVPPLEPAATDVVATPPPDAATAPATDPPPAGPTSTIATSTIATSTSTTSTSTTSSTVPPTRTVTMAFSGDTLPHSPLWRRAADNAALVGSSGFDFGPMLAGLAPLLDTVDLAVCHLETPIAPAGEELSTMPLYGVPAEIADAIADAGYDRCSTASNHSLDRGAAGVDRTVEVLAAAGLDQSGMARTPDEIEPQVFEAGGVAISHLSYTWSYNGLRTPADEPWRSALIDPHRIVDDAREARRRGAEVVVVSVHAGTEGSTEPTQYQRDLAAWLAASGEVDLVVGHHAHVVQPIEQVHGVWVLFGLGNILSNLPTSDRWPAAAQDGVVVTVAVHVAADGGVDVDRPVAHATWVDKEAGWVVRVVDDALADQELPGGKRFQLEASRARTMAVVGAFAPPHVDPEAHGSTRRTRPHQNFHMSSCNAVLRYASVYMTPSGVSCTMPAFAGSAHSGRSSGIEGEEPNTS